MRFWATEKFQRLQDKWYKKLEQSGFEDIEIHPKRLHEDTAKVADFEAIKQYYRQANIYTHQATFSSKREEVIWRMHCEGLSLREIGRLIKVSKTTVQRTLEKHQQLLKTLTYVD